MLLHYWLITLIESKSDSFYQPLAQTQIFLGNLYCGKYGLRPRKLEGRAGMFTVLPRLEGSRGTGWKPRCKCTSSGLATGSTCWVCLTDDTEA